MSEHRYTPDPSDRRAMTDFILANFPSGHCPTAWVERALKAEALAERVGWLNEKVAALTELVRKVEWGSDYYGETCPWCAGLKESMGFEPPPGHASDCPAAPYLTREPSEVPRG